MIEAPEPRDEESRLAALRATGLLDTLPEQDFDELVELASLLCGTPMALVSLVDENRQWFKAKVGLDAEETPRNVAFCAHAILEPQKTLEVPNALDDLRFHDNPLVAGAPHLRAYYGRPLLDTSGAPLGTLCVLDLEPHELDEMQLRGLEILARQVEAQIELRRSRDQALAAVSAKSQFLTTMSHEIRTPLNGVLGTLELLLEDELPEALTEDLSMALGAGRQLHGLLNSVLDISKSSAGKLELHPVPTRLSDLVGIVVATHAGSARHRRLKLESVIESEVPSVVLVDGVRLSQVLGNLIGNAIKFTKSGQVSLSVHTAGGGRIAFAVQDTGCGIAADDAERIFERFEQIGSGAGGTGIGLALCRELVQHMGGTLELESELGRGSRFSFELALPAADEAALEAQVPSVELPPARVLLVDDEPVNLRVGERLLERLGLEVVTAQGGREALDAAREDTFDAILLDCCMDEIDGYEVARRLRGAHGPNARTPILALTASVVDEVDQACREAGMDEVLEKPIDRAALVAALASCLRVSAG